MMAPRKHSLDKTLFCAAEGEGLQLCCSLYRGPGFRRFKLKYVKSLFIFPVPPDMLRSFPGLHTLSVLSRPGNSKLSGVIEQFVWVTERIERVLPVEEQGNEIFFGEYIQGKACEVGVPKVSEALRE
jgi:hypothetical protein